MQRQAHRPISLPLTLALLLAAPVYAQAQEAPRTAAEVSGFERTSTHAEVVAFVRALSGLPHADRLRVESAGTTNEGRDLLTVTVGAPLPRETRAAEAGTRLRILINANIHGGEVEGKEAVQQVLREFALGEHEDLLAGAVVVFVPVYNADGNDDLSRRNRVSQNGPEEGVGKRPNAQGLDLNRDFVKVESPECQGLLALVNRWDPHIFMDLHTTNGSSHGYHLTYSPSLATNVDADLDGFVRTTFLPEVRAATFTNHGFRTFDYGNFSRGEEKSWETYDHRPRFGTNYMGLRNRLSVLSEAYSYVSFEKRVAVTRAFVLENLRAAVGHAEEIRRLCAQADRRALERDSSVRFAWDTQLADGHVQDVLVGTLSSVEIEGIGTRRVVESGFHAEPMVVRDGFTSTKSVALPAAWVLPDPSAAVTAALAHHGIEVTRLATAAEVEVRTFVIAELERAERPFQGHHEVRLTGEWTSVQRTLPAGALVIPANQRLGRVAAQLLEPESEDSLATWNFFDERLEPAVPGEPRPVYPVLRLESVEGLVMGGD